MSTLLVLKNIHVACAAISISGFLLRGAWMISGSSLLQHRLTRILPHVVDTLLLVSALWMALLLQQYPFGAGWLTAKVVALLAYIALGTVALKRGRTRGARIAAMAAAVAVYGYIVAVALTHDPLPI